MAVSDLDSGLSGRDHYAEIYRSHLAREAEWLRRTSGQKADSIVRLLRSAGLSPTSVLEVGAGTGAVIGALQERGIGSDHFAVDFSADALEELGRAFPTVQTAVADVTETPDPFDAGPYDLAFASHVVEHLEEPVPFLRSLLDVPLRYFVAEVPLENLLGGRLKASIKDRSTNAAGHVQFFTRDSFLALLNESGWNVEGVEVYAPVLDDDTLDFSYGSASAGKRWAKRLTESVLPRSLGTVWTSLYHAHCAVLCTKPS